MRALCVLSLALTAIALPVFAEDVEGSEDHPLITRYPGSEITWYDQEEFLPYKIAVGPVTGYRAIDDWIEVEGKLTRINYDLMGDRTFYEVYSNYASALKKAGFEVLAEGHIKSGERSVDVGSHQFTEVHFRENVIPPGGSRLFQGSSTSGGRGFFAGKLSREEGDVYAVVSVFQHRADWVVTFVDIIESRPMEDDLVTVDADFMAKEIQSVGKVVLYGILFDHDKATIKPESKPVLDEIAKFLENAPDMKVWVVGHTDSSGALDYNMRLSADRAASVVKALTDDYGIAAHRLDPHGVGPLVPVASNAGDAGKGKNRRVELVER
jgi:flagellar motor protein MotB